MKAMAANVCGKTLTELKSLYPDAGEYVDGFCEGMVYIEVKTISAI